MTRALDDKGQNMRQRKFAKSNYNVVVALPQVGKTGFATDSPRELG